MHSTPIRIHHESSNQPDPVTPSTLGNSTFVATHAAQNQTEVNNTSFQNSSQADHELSSLLRDLHWLRDANAASVLSDHNNPTVTQDLFFV